MAKILFCNPCDEFLAQKGDRAPLGLGYLCSFVKSLGHEARIFDLNHDKEEDMIKFAEEWKPDFACISVATPNYNIAARLAIRLRQTLPNVKLVAGGNHITAFPYEEKTLKLYDYAVMGDGENGLAEILDGRAKTQVVFSTDVNDIDVLPFPDYDELKFDRYFMKVNNKLGATMVTSRGCVFSCYFCGSAKIKKWRPRSPENVIQEMEILYHKWKREGFYFGDDIFTFNKPRVYQICKLMKERLPPVTWRATTRVDLVDKPLLEAMHDAGCDIISFGFESGNDRILKLIKKGPAATVARARETARLCKEIGIKVKGFFIIGHPGETWEDAMDTINLAKELQLEYADFYPLTPYPSSPFWDYPDEYGIKIKTPIDSDWEGYFQVNQNTTDFDLKIEHPYLSHEQIKELLKLGREAISTGLTYK